MRIAVARETDAAEPRVAATPDTVKKLKALGAEVAVARGAGITSGIPDADYKAAGAEHRRGRHQGRRRGAEGAPPGAQRTCPPTKRARSSSPSWIRYGNEAALKQMADAGLGRLRHGADAAHHARAVDGRAVQPGQSRRLSRGDRCRRGIRPRAADDDDGGRHRAGGEGVHHGRRRRRPAGDRHRAPPRRHRHRDRRAARHQGAGRKPRREIPRGRGRGIQERADRRRLRQGNVEGVSGQAGGARRRAHQEAGHRHHHRADSRAARRRG